MTLQRARPHMEPPPTGPLPLVCAYCSTPLPAQANYCFHCGEAVITSIPGPHVYAIANHDGKVGKTTTAVNLGACLAEAGCKVLVVDMCPNSRATTSLGVEASQVSLSVYELLVKDDVASDQVIKTEVCPNLSILPSNAGLYTAEQELVNLDERETRLRCALESVRPDFDFILIDCPSSLGLLTTNALVAADGIILPLECEKNSLQEIQILLNTVHVIRDRFNPQITLFGLVLTKYDPRDPESTEVVREVSEHFPKEQFNTIIGLNARLKEAPRYGKTILQHDPRSPGAIAYRQLAEEVVTRAEAIARADIVEKRRAQQSSSSTIVNQDAASLGQDAAAPRQDTEVPGHDTAPTPSRDAAAVPGQDTDVAGSLETDVADGQATAAAASQGAKVPGQDAAAPKQDSEGVP
jgi:chromosome partitioning protein